jgi:hypothetical protein
VADLAIPGSGPGERGDLGEREDGVGRDRAERPTERLADAQPGEHGRHQRAGEETARRKRHPNRDRPDRGAT